jgi:hypothetical protein
MERHPQGQHETGSNCRNRDQEDRDVANQRGEIGLDERADIAASVTTLGKMITAWNIKGGPHIADFNQIPGINGTDLRLFVDQGGRISRIIWISQGRINICRRSRGFDLNYNSVHQREHTHQEYGRPDNAYRVNWR